MGGPLPLLDVCALEGGDVISIGLVEKSVSICDIVRILALFLPKSSYIDKWVLRRIRWMLSATPVIDWGRFGKASLVGLISHGIS